MRYFSAESLHGSSSSHGFSNDTQVYVFGSKKARDKYVRESTNISCKAIPAKRATKEATNWSLTQNCDIKPNTFKGEYWGIDDSWLMYGDMLPEGLLGQLTVCDDNNCGGERFYKQ